MGGGRDKEGTEGFHFERQRGHAATRRERPTADAHGLDLQEAHAAVSVREKPVIKAGSKQGK